MLSSSVGATATIARSSGLRVILVKARLCCSVASSTNSAPLQDYQIPTIEDNKLLGLAIEQGRAATQEDALPQVVAAWFQSLSLTNEGTNQQT